MSEMKTFEVLSDRIVELEEALGVEIASYIQDDETLTAYYKKDGKKHGAHYRKGFDLDNKPTLTYVRTFQLEETEKKKTDHLPKGDRETTARVFGKTLKFLAVTAVVGAAVVGGGIYLYKHFTE